jgi:hypothetical protein
MKITHIFLAMFLFIFIITSCAKPSCSKFYSMIKKCADKEFKQSEDEFVKECEKDKDSEESKKMLECSLKSECGDFEKCVKEVSEDMRIKDDLEALKKAMADKNYQDLAFNCSINKENFDNDKYKEIKEFCSNNTKTALEAMTKQMTDMIDKGEFPENTYTVCAAYKDLAKSVSPEEEKKAETLCDNLDEAKQAKQTLDNFNKDIAEKKIKEATFTCNYEKEKFGKAAYGKLKEACAGFFKTALADMTKELTDIRDKGETPEDIYTKCFDFSDIAKGISEEENKKAEVLCKEVKVNKDIAKTLEEVKQNMTAQEKSVPYGCEAYVKDLEEIGTEWAKKKSEEFVKACYVELGKAILKPALENMTYCGYAEKKIFEAVKKYNLKDAELDPLIEKATPFCSQ